MVYSYKRAAAYAPPPQLPADMIRMAEFASQTRFNRKVRLQRPQNRQISTAISFNASYYLTTPPIPPVCRLNSNTLRSSSSGSGSSASAGSRADPVAPDPARSAQSGWAGKRGHVNQEGDIDIDETRFSKRKPGPPESGAGGETDSSEPQHQTSFNSSASQSLSLSFSSAITPTAAAGGPPIMTDAGAVAGAGAGSASEAAPVREQRQIARRGPPRGPSKLGDATNRGPTASRR